MGRNGENPSVHLLFIACFDFSFEADFNEISNSLSAKNITEIGDIRLFVARVLFCKCRKEVGGLCITIFINCLNLSYAIMCSFCEIYCIFIRSLILDYPFQYFNLILISLSFWIITSDFLKVRICMRIDKKGNILINLLKKLQNSCYKIKNHNISRV